MSDLPGDAPADVLRMITAEHVEPLAAGATLLGSGGGGDTTHGALLLRQQLAASGTRTAVPVVAAEDLPADALVVHAGVGGAPDVLAERLIDPAGCAQAVEEVRAHHGGELAAVGLIEIGGLNALMGVLVAALLDVPVVDGDLMGRAFPRLDQATLTLAGHSIAPMAVVGPAGDTVLVTRASAPAAQALMVSSAAAFGGAASVAMFPARAGALVQHGVRRSLSACVGIGRAYLAAVERRPIAEVVELIGGRVIAEGRVDEIRARDGDLSGSITLADHRTGAAVRVDHLEEYLALTVDGLTLARTPEVIVALDPRARRPMRTDEVRLGQLLTLATLPPLHAWPTGAADVVGPAGFGLRLDEVRLDEVRLDEVRQ